MTIWRHLVSWFVALFVAKPYVDKFNPLRKTRNLTQEAFSSWCSTRTSGRHRAQQVDRKQTLLPGNKKCFRLKSETFLFPRHEFLRPKQMFPSLVSMKTMLISFQCRPLIKKYFQATMGGLQPPIVLWYLHRTLSLLFFSANLYLGLFLSSSKQTIIQKAAICLPFWRRRHLKRSNAMFDACSPIVSFAAGFFDIPINGCEGD